MLVRIDRAQMRTDAHQVVGWAACANGQPSESIDTCIGGTRGAFQKWTPLPANFKSGGLFRVHGLGLAV